MSLSDLINSDQAIEAAAQARDFETVLAWLNDPVETRLALVSRAWLATWAAGTGMRAIMQDVANTNGHPLRSIALATLDVLAGAADGIDFSNPANVASVQAWVTAGLMTQADADALFAMGTEACGRAAKHVGRDATLQDLWTLYPA